MSSTDELELSDELLRTWLKAARTGDLTLGANSARQLIEEVLRLRTRAGETRDVPIDPIDGSRPILFLDLDGVLNWHVYNQEARSSKLEPQCIAPLNRVLKATGCSIVIISAWRYVVSGGAMTLSGFEYMLRSHWIKCPGRVVGITRNDRSTESDPNERGEQIKEWLAEHPQVKRYAILDDMQEGFAGMKIVRTNGQVGLTEPEADRLIELLKSEGP